VLIFPITEIEHDANAIAADRHYCAIFLRGMPHAHSWPKTELSWISAALGSSAIGDLSRNARQFLGGQPRRALGRERNSAERSVEVHVPYLDNARVPRRDIDRTGPGRCGGWERPTP
jgi:hypothetical protein